MAYKRGDYEGAIARYKAAHQIEPEMPHYQLNMAAAYLKVQKYVLYNDYSPVIIRDVKFVIQMDRSRKSV